MQKLNLKNNPTDKRPKRRQPKSSWQRFSYQLITTVLILFAVISLYSIITGEFNEVAEISVSELAKDITDEKILAITVLGDKLEIVYNDGVSKESKKELEAALSETLANYGVTAEMLQGIKIDIKGPSGFGYWMRSLLPFLIPILFIVFFIWFLSRQMKGSAMQAFSFGQSKARIIDPNDRKQRVTFADVAGVKEAKEELLEVVDFLKNPKKFLDIGARIPKGVLLMGAPGTGKTLLARAVAGEARVPFLYLSGSEFVEMFVGVGASRVRDLFKMAKRIAPAIIFVDEIDAVGRHRGVGVGGGNDEREQTLNQILVELDGFEPSEKVIVMAATNRPDVLDPALLRPGRFDRRVILDLPDIDDREGILKIHSVKKPLAEDVVLRVIAERTPGLSGADLANIFNEASILAARENRKKVTQYDLIRSIEKTILGPERKSHILAEKEKEITAYHEMGHSLVASVLPDSDPVHKVTIISRGRAAGYTLKLPLEEKRLQSKKAFLDDLAVSLGGYVAEKMIFNDLTTGAANDLAVATNLARNMVIRYGMSDAIGPVAYEENSTANIVPGTNISTKPFSEEVAGKIDAEVSKLMHEAQTRAEVVLKKHKKALDSISKHLVEVETLEQKEFDEQLVLNGIKPKRKPDKKGKVVAG